MIWRALVLFDVLTIGRYFYLTHGETAAWVAIGGMMAVLLPLNQLVSSLAKIETHMAEQKALLSKILKGYVR